MSDAANSTASSSSSPSNNENNGIPATSQQMDEMISLLRSLSKDGKDVDISKAQATLLQRQSQGNFSGNGGSAAVDAYSLPFAHRARSLPPFCHPLRRFISTQKPLTIVLFLLCLIGTTVYFSENKGALSHSSLYPSAGTAAAGGGNGIMSSFSIPMEGTYGLKDTTLYYNTNGHSIDPNSGELSGPQSMSRVSYPDNGSVIAALCTNKESDVSDLQTALRSLAFLRGDQPDAYSKRLKTPVLVFNEGDLGPEQIKRIVGSTDRPVAFPLVDFQAFPNGFNPEENAAMFEVSGRKPWGYYQMIRFWVTQIWHHPALERYETVMRIDSDSCFLAPNDYLPHLAHDHLNYHSQYVGVVAEAGRDYINGLFDFTVEYMRRVNKTPGNVMLWNFIEHTWKSDKTLPVFRTNFEVSRKSYMLREDVVKWHNALTEEEPFGLLRYRWGDAIIRYLEAAIFCTDEEILTIRPTGYDHKKGCPAQLVDEALKLHGLV